MRILAFDTSSSACSVALLNTDKVAEQQIVSLHRDAPKQHARLILPMIETLLAQAELTLNDLNAIAYGCGPGSFTGIRIASCVVQALGLVASLPIVQISSLAALAQIAFIESNRREILVALDAHMNEIYWAHYSVKSSDLVAVVGKEEVYNPKEATIYKDRLNLLTKGKNSNNLCDKRPYFIGIGSGWERYHEALIAQLGFRPDVILSPSTPIAEGVLRLAQDKLEKGEFIALPREAIPVYLR